MNSSMFPLLCAFASASINGFNKVTCAARIYEFHNTSGAPLNDAVGYPKLFRPRSCFSGIGASKILFSGVNGL